MSQKKFKNLSILPNVISLLHNGTIGDVIAAIPGMRELHKKTGKKLNLYLVNGQKAEYYMGAIHPTRNEKDEQVMLNEAMIKMMIPLFMAQGFFNEVKEWKKQPYHLDLNRIRETNVGMPNGCISRWYFYIFPDMACDLTEQWLTVPDSKTNLAKDKIIITRTERYLNPNISYKFLKKYQKDILFVGTDIEYVIFKCRFGLMDLQRLVIKDFLQLAQALKQCKFHLSNQTMAFQISQGLKIPRLLEYSTLAPNVMVMGKDAYDFLAQEGLEYGFHKLNGSMEEYIETMKKINAMQNPVKKTGLKKAIAK